ncbi:sigma-54 interaction domain-containing protein [Paraflavitalea pollutisoli]|uniref:sigma-54 interaction domain-containing protein n=1 Tax=Paraflavitalea pollutisoli TaxID=3034143 RepID=UPI0023EBFC93|nr:sigma 54-interacting transcriptional regulator [Paraflavitalea sp. H1-2-19X]
MKDSKEITANTKEQQYQLLLTLANNIAGARNRADLWEILTDQLLSTLHASYYTVCLINDNDQTHSPFLYSTPDSIPSVTGESPIIQKKHDWHDGIFDRGIASETPLIFDLDAVLKTGNAPQYVYHWYNSGIREMAVARIMHAKEPKGLLYLYARQKGSFTRDQYNLLRAITDMLGSGISNILANEKIEAQLQEIDQYRRQLEQENNYLREERSKHQPATGSMIGQSAAMQTIQEWVSKVSPTDTTVLILGETGTGKEMIAHAIHAASSRSQQLMIKVNCAALPANLIESELFGHEKGSFTGALERRIGKIELANNSTLFLDEIGEMPLELQAKILRALQEKEIERIGGNATIKVNVRLIAATNRNLQQEVAAGRFRHDLYYRLNVFPVELPPLRQRREDIPLLANSFMQRFAGNMGKQLDSIAPAAMKKLLAYHWPGNIRELEHLLERTVLLTTSSTIEDIQLPGNAHELLPGTADQVQSLADMEREYILKIVRLSGGRISGPSGAAAKLQLPHTTLISKMQKLGIRKTHFLDGAHND